MITKEMIMKELLEQINGDKLMYPGGGWIDPTAEVGDDLVYLDATISLEKLAEYLNKEQEDET